MYLFLRKHADRLHEDVLEGGDSSGARAGPARCFLFLSGVPCVLASSSWRRCSTGKRLMSPSWAGFPLRRTRPARPALPPPPGAGESLWSKLGSWGKGGKPAARGKEDTIHVFTVASGHMCAPKHFVLF